MKKIENVSVNINGRGMQLFIRQICMKLKVLENYIKELELENEELKKIKGKGKGKK